MRFEVLTADVDGGLLGCDAVGLMSTNVSEEHTVSIFRAETTHKTTVDFTLTIIYSMMED
jgi:hypothetical protein